MNGVSFGSFLRRFAYAIDVVDDVTINRVGELLRAFLGDELQIDFFEVMREATVNNRAGLRTLWTSEKGRVTANALRSSTGEIIDHVAYAFIENRKLWLVDQDRNPLEEDGEVVDLWSGASGFPCRKRSDSLESRTSIVIPLKPGGRSLGSMCLESKNYLEATEIAKEELVVLADAIGTLFYNHEANQYRRSATEEALGDLAGILQVTKFPQLTKPEVFVASPAGGDEQVLGVIRETLEEFSDQVKPIYWSDIRASGPVDQHIADAVHKSKFAICYLCEPDPSRQDGEPYYRYNPNVLFEAGMFESLSEHDQTAGWIPLKEKDSPQAPFDFAHHRIETVPRHKDSRLNQKALKEALVGRISALLDVKDVPE